MLGSFLGDLRIILGSLWNHWDHFGFTLKLSWEHFWVALECNWAYLWIIFAFILVILVLMQKSEGGALGIGVSQESYMFSRTAGNFMTKATAVIATLFIICSLALTIVSRGELTPTSSVLDTVKEKTEDTPSIPENNN